MAIDVSAASYESGRRALHLAANGDSSSVQEIALLLLQEAEDHGDSSSLECSDGRGAVGCNHHKALEVAASAGDIDAVERLLAAGADPNAPVHELAISALEAAATQGHLIVVKKLLEKGAHPDHCGKRSETTPLIAGARAGHTGICEALVRGGADVAMFKLTSEWAEPAPTAIEVAGESVDTAVLEILLRVIEDKARGFDADKLELAIAEGRQGDSWRLLRTKAFLKRAQPGLDRALKAAAANGNMLILQRLLDAGADIVGRGDWDPNAIAASALGGQLEAMNKLLQTASDQNALREDVVTVALQSALSAGHTALIEPLLENGADATRLDIRRAAAEGHADALAHILQAGALVETTGYNNGFTDVGFGLVTALQLAAQYGHHSVVDLLLAKGADVNKCEPNILGSTSWMVNGGTALQFAVAGGHLAVMGRIIDGGADVNKTYHGADTPLQTAVRTGNMAALELLLAAGADVDAFVGGEELFSQGREKTALSVAAAVGNLDLVARLLSKMSPARARQAIPWALFEAAQNGFPDIVRKLLQLKPDVNMRRGEKKQDKAGELTLLQAAAANGNLEILEMLLSEGADVNLNLTRGWDSTALQFASERGDLAAVKLLLAAGAEVDVTGSTAPPLLLAIRGGHLQVSEYLLAAGADNHATAYRGQTISEAAEDSEDTKMVEWVQVSLKIRSLPPPQIDQSLGGTGPICEACRLMPLAELFWSQRDDRLELHPSLTALWDSAAAGCPFCCFLWKRLGITSISIPQPSPVILSRPPWEDTGRVHCYVAEPFPRDPNTPESLSAEFSIHGEISLGSMLTLLKK